MLHLFDSEKLCFFAGLKYLIGLIKCQMGNSEAGERIGGAGKQREQIGGKTWEEEIKKEPEKEERGMQGASHPATQ